MNDFLKFLHDVLRDALSIELSTPVGRVNLVFGIVAAAMVGLLYAKALVGEIGEIILRLFGRHSSKTKDKDKLWALISLFAFFLASLVIVGVFLPSK